MKPIKKKTLLDYILKAGIIRPKELGGLGINPSYLNILHKQGAIQKLEKGLYASLEYEFDENQSFIEVCKLIPQGAICLLSALRYHKVTTQNPYQVWLAIPNKARKPHIEYPPLKVCRFSGAALEEGLEIVKIGEQRLRVYNLEKTICDCFKYRNKIGLDVAIEALRESWHKKLITMKSLHYYSKICKIQNIIKPYIDSLIN